MITSNEKNALIRYLDFQLKSFVDIYENHVDEDVLQSMYDNIYRVLVDVNTTLATDMIMKTQASLNHINKKIDDIDKKNGKKS